MPDKIDLIGRRVGRLTVLEYSHHIVSKGENAKRASILYYWKCRCDCGNITYVNRQSLVLGRSRSCGCLRSELARERQSDVSRRSGYFKNKNKYR